ncbi:MAG: hypothetical protein WA071_01980 [Undibacterium umbellatum]|uniref:hypothetical protein n=1 Tax=Undibacterium umbellatum TaxID=2762300 RepID=UPI003BB673FB
MNNIALQRGRLAHTEVGEFGDVSPVAPVSVTTRQLMPGELQASLPGMQEQDHTVNTCLRQALGPYMTNANPAWTSGAVPRMRALQKRLLSVALDQPEEERMPVLEGINVIESAIIFRLRLAQMDMQASVSHIDSEEIK